MRRGVRGARKHPTAPRAVGIARLRERQRQLIESAERYRLALWAGGDELFDWDLTAGTLLSVSGNPDREPGEAVPLPGVEAFAQYLHPEDFPGYRDAMQDHLAGKTPHYEAVYRLRAPGGAWSWKLARGMIVARDAAGLPLRIAETQHDISAIKAVESDLLELTRELDARVHERTRELHQERQDLQEANRRLLEAIDELHRTQSELIESEKMASLGRLVAGVAHEVNTPLGVGVTAISFLSAQLRAIQNALERGLSAGEVRTLLASAQAAGTMAENNLLRAAELIRSFKQVAVDQATGDIRTINLQAYLDGILKSLHPALRKTNHQVLVDCSPIIEVSTRPDALYQIVSNLVMNSLLHAFPDKDAGTIRISVLPQDQQLTLRYEDDGVGMDAHVADRVFEPFFTTKRGRGGTGLGMLVAFNLVTQALGGRISLITQPGKGVRFDIVLPSMAP